MGYHGTCPWYVWHLWNNRTFDSTIWTKVSYPNWNVNSFNILSDCPVSPKFLPLALALFLLGVGWNFCFIGGSSLLSSTLLPIERGRIQGINETFIALAASLASLTTGYLFDLGGITLLAVIGILSSLTLGIKCFFYNINQIEKI